MINGKSTYSSYLLRICHADGNGRLHIYLHPIQKSEKALHFAEIEPFFHYLQTALINGYHSTDTNQRRLSMMK